MKMILLILVLGLVLVMACDDTSRTMILNGGGSDTNESARINSIIDIDCDADQYIYGFENDGTKKCRVDQVGEGGDYDLNVSNGSSSEVITNGEILGFLAGNNTNISLVGNEFTISSSYIDTSCNTSSCNLSDDVGFSFTNLDLSGTTGFDDYEDDVGIDTDTNVTTACEGNQVLLGNGSCISTTSFTTNGGSQGYFWNQTDAVYSGDLDDGGYSGYDAFNYLCNQSFVGTHACSEDEMIATMRDKDYTNLQDWTGYPWVIAGGTKYVPASKPANDCNGWDDGTTSYIGNIWNMEDNMGQASQCNSERNLTCCKNY